MAQQETNWAGNYVFSAAKIHTPPHIEALQSLVIESRRVKAIGARHSFNAIADSEETMIGLNALPEECVLHTDDAGKVTAVTVSAGMTYARLGELLHAAGYAVHNMASLPHITVAGAIATATHGSGDRNGNLATAVLGLEMVGADGELRRWTRETDGEDFSGAVVNLGGLGIVVRVTLAVRPTFRARQWVFEGLALEQLAGNFDALMGCGYSVSLFTDWQTRRINQVWVKAVLETDGVGEGEPDELADSLNRLLAGSGAVAATTPLHPSGRSPADSCTPQMGIAGPWHERLPHFRPEFAPSMGNELQTEYFVPRSRAMEALETVAGLGQELRAGLLVSEVRTIAADELWLSPAYGQDCVGIHFTWRNDWALVSALLPTLESALAPYGARPHWGKLFLLEGEPLRSLYPRMGDFAGLLARVDPVGKFRNAYLEAFLP